MLIALLFVMAGVLLLTVVFNNRREPSRWDRRGTGDHGGSAWAYGGDAGGDSGGDCGSGADGGSCDGGGSGGGGD
jgi:hypothetical protein